MVVLSRTLLTLVLAACAVALPTQHVDADLAERSPQIEVEAWGKTPPIKREVEVDSWGKTRPIKHDVEAAVVKRDVEVDAWSKPPVIKARANSG